MKQTAHHITLSQSLTTMLQKPCAERLRFPLVILATVIRAAHIAAGWLMECVAHVLIVIQWRRKEMAKCFVEKCDKQNPTLAYALSLWADWMRNDFAEIRSLWYPAKSLVLEPRQSVTEETETDTGNSIEHRVAIEVNNAVRNLTPTQRYALERSLGLVGAVARVRDFDQRLSEAHDRVWRHILSMGCV